MSWVAVAIGGSALIGGGASLLAADKQSDAAGQALAFQKQTDARNQQNFEPYLGIGKDATNKLSGIMSGDMTNFFASPDYQFRFGEGMRGLENSAAARGGLLSGNFLRGATDYGQKAASQEFGNYWNRLQETARLGQNSAAGSGALGVQSAGQIGNTTMAQGAADASGYVGAANAVTGGAQNYLFMNAMQNRPGSVYSGSSAIGGGYGNSAGQYNPNVPGGFLGYS